MYFYNPLPKKKNPIDITAMLDMIFLLLIFLIIGTQLKKPALDIDLPEIQVDASTFPKSTIVIRIDKNNKIFMNEKLVSLKLLGNLLSKLPVKESSKNVLLQADKVSSFQSFLSVIELLQKNKISSLHIEGVYP